jgi:chloramphenicol-sensitive protein RarD
MDDEHSGVLMGVAAYVAWGFLPLYWPLLRPAGAVEILAHRIAWSVLFLLLLLAHTGGFARIRQLDGPRLRRLAVAACFIGVNWLAYIWGVTTGHVVETALGYFVNPLITVMLGVVVLRESVMRLQWVAIAIAALAVTVLTVDYGRLPWLALVLAFSFGGYGLLKKQAGVGAIESLAVETAILFVPSVGYLLMLESRREGTFAHSAPLTSTLLAFSGVLTALPLLCFAGAAKRIPLRTLGLLQYVSPTLQFVCGVLVFHEPMPQVRWLGFILVWIAVALFVWGGRPAPTS